MVEIIESQEVPKFNLTFKADTSSLGDPINIEAKEVPYYGVILGLPGGDLIDMDGPSNYVILAVEYIRESIKQIFDGKAFYGQYLGSQDPVSVEVETYRGHHDPTVTSYAVFYGEDDVLVPQVKLYGSVEELVYLVELSSTMYKVGDVHQRQIRMAQMMKQAGPSPEEIAEFDKKLKSH